MSFPELPAAAIFQTAINEQRAGELLEALFDGASATVDRGTGKLVIIPSTQIQMFAEDATA